LQASDPARVFTTRDLSFAAFVQMRGLRLKAAKRAGRREFLFHFFDPDNRGSEMKVDWVNSEFHRYDSVLRSLKKIVMGGADGDGSPEA